MPKDILVVDVGGTHIKIKSSNLDERRSIDSAPKKSASRAVKDVKRFADGWTYSAVSIGIPAPVIHGHILHEPDYVVVGGGNAAAVPSQ